MFAKKLISRKLFVLLNGALILIISTLATSVVHAQRPVGTDVSGYQPANINWTAAKNDGDSFAWVKATEGTYYVNPNFTSQITGAAAAGVYVGAYHFARPSDDPNITGANSADSEAAYFWSVAGSYVKLGGGYLVPMLDWEDTGATNGRSGISITQMSQWVNEWCTAVSNDAAGEDIIIRPVVYTGTWYSVPSSGGFGYPGLNTTVTNWPDWFAAYPLNANAQTGTPGGNTPWPSWDIWQYGDTNWTGGDSDVYNGNFQNFLQMFAVGGTNAPYFVVPPANITVALGSNATLSAQTSGQSPTFQWYFKGAAIPGATSSNYTLVDAQLADAGAYTVIASNSYASIPAVAFLSVVAPLVNAANSALDPTNMVNWWTGDGNFNDIYGITNLTPNGNVSFTNGYVGLAFRLDGSSAYMTSSGGEIAPPWTICGWVYHQRGHTASAALAGDSTYALKVEQWSNTDEVGISHSGVADYLFSPAYTVPLNTWTHLAFVANSSTVTLYANGVQKGTVSASNFELPRAFFGVDTFASVPTDYILGSVDELQIYTNALGASQIASIYNAGTAGLVRAPEFTSVSGPANGQIQLNLIGMTGKTFVIDSSSDLVNWTFAGKVKNPTGAATYTESLTNGQTFYRALAPY
jgi:GH25 family lysozyme M1 (1,4-beta-N-acetylmuramidase)